MAQSHKRQADQSSARQSKKVKYNKFKTTNRGSDNSLSAITTIEPGSAGIFATCVRGLEAKATAQLRDVLDEYAAELYPQLQEGGNNPDNLNVSEASEENGDVDDIEAAIRIEVEEAKQKSSNLLFKTVRMDVACVLFFIVDPPIDPVTLVYRICEDAKAGKARKKTRHVNRLTPMSLMGKASIEGLEKLAKQILAPHFHQEDGASKTFAIRPTVRNSDTIRSSEAINKVASLVGSRHRVDLNRPDLVILINIYRNICGMSVVSGEYEQMKRFNLNELYADEEQEMHENIGITAVSPISNKDGAIQKEQL